MTNEEASELSAEEVMADLDDDFQREIDAELAAESRIKAWDDERGNQP